MRLGDILNYIAKISNQNEKYNYIFHFKTDNSLSECFSLFLKLLVSILNLISYKAFRKVMGHNPKTPAGENCGHLIGMCLTLTTLH